MKSKKYCVCQNLDCYNDIPDDKPCSKYCSSKCRGESMRESLEDAKFYKTLNKKNL